ncbi:kinase-like protein [Rhizopogon salebrosus TDB-379]|nr:kinase-like protein [Rhizopogon salebrosus TDB-379]
MAYMSNNSYLALEVISGTNLSVPSERTSAGLYVTVTTPSGRWNTAIKTVMDDHSVPWNETIIILALPLMLPTWLMPIVPRFFKAVHFEIRASFEYECLGRGELLGIVDTTLEELLSHAGEQFQMCIPAVGNAQCPSIILRARRIKAPYLVARAVPAGGALQSSHSHSVIGRTTDAAHKAYTLYRKSGHPNHLHSAIQGFQVVLDQCPDGHPHRAAALSNLAHAILYGFTKELRTDIDHAISLFRSALVLRPREHPDHILSILNLCQALHHRHLHRKGGADLREAAEHYRSLLPLCVEGSHLQLCAIEQCNALHMNPSDTSIALRRTVLEHCSPRHQHRARSLSRLAEDLHARFIQSGNIDHIHEAVHLSREALAVCPADGQRSFFLNVLFYYTFEWLRHRGYSRDIGKCITQNQNIIPHLNQTACGKDNAPISNQHNSLGRPPAEEQVNQEPTGSVSDLLPDLTNILPLPGRSSYPVTYGGFGDIWQCDLVQPSGIVRVAAKTIRFSGLDGDAVMSRKAEKLRRELKVWSRLRHERILPLLGVAYDFGPHTAMICPWVDGGALTDFLTSRQGQETLTCQDKFSLLNDIALGLQYLHSKSIVHGDLTGSNVLVYSDGRACLADFGLSTIPLELEGSSYLPSPIRGNVRWAAAELFERPEDSENNEDSEDGEDSEESKAVVSLSTECDIYSFGSITLQVLTYKRPYYNLPSDMVVSKQVIQGIKPVPPTESRMTPMQWEFIQRCWLPRANRPSMGEIAEFVAHHRGPA